MANILILGAGGFGTALAVLCDKCGHRVTLYSPFQQEIETLSAARVSSSSPANICISPHAASMLTAAFKICSRICETDVCTMLRFA